MSRTKPLALTHFAAIALCGAACILPHASAQSDKGPPRIRHVYIPQTELEAIFGEGNKGTLMTRDEFQKLWDTAQRAADLPSAPPADAVVTRAQYEAEIADHQLQITARLRLHKLGSGWQIVELPFAGVAVQSATVDDEPARLGRDRGGVLIWAVRDAGQSELVLEMSAPLARTGGDLTTWIELPRLPASQFVLRAPAGKQLRVGGLEISPDDPDNERQTFRIPIDASGRVPLAILDRGAESDRHPLLFVTSDWTATVEPAGVRWQADVRLDVAARAAASFELSLPETMEVAAVEAPDLATWKLESNDNRSNLLLTFHQPVLGARAVRLSGLLPIQLGEPWNMPAIAVRGAVSHVGEIKLAATDTLHLRTRELAQVRRLPWESENKNVPPGTHAGQLRFAFWSEQFQLELLAQARQRALAVAAATLVDVERHGLTLRTSVTLEPRYAPLFDVTLELPADWNISSVIAGKQRVPWDRTNHRLQDPPPIIAAAPGDREPGSSRRAVQQVRLDLPQPIMPGNTTTLLIVAERHPAGWLESTAEASIIPIPRFRVVGADEVEGSLTIEAPPELDLHATELSADLEPTPPAPRGTAPATAAPAASPGTVLSYRYQDDAELSGRIEARVKPAQLSVETLALAALGRESLALYYQVEIQVAGGFQRHFEFTLPASAGEKVQITPLNAGARVIEQQHSPSPDSGDSMLWRFSLDRPVSDKLTLAVAFEQPLGNGTAAHPPTVLAALAFHQAARQSGYIAVQAAPDQEVHVQATQLRDVDPADLPDWVAHQPGRIVAAYHYQRLPFELTLSGEQRESQEVLAGVCDQGTITTIVGRHGILRHEATYRVRARGVQHFAMQLPAGAHLWSVMLDGTPIEARRTNGNVIVPLPAAPSNTDDPHYRVAAVYETTLGDSATHAGLLPQTIRQHAPTVNMTTLQLDWSIHLPDGTALVSTGGDFQPGTEPTRPSFVAALRETIARESARDLATKSLWLLAAFIAAAGVWVVAQLTSLPARVTLWSALGGCAVLAVCVVVLWPSRVMRQAARVAYSDQFRTTPSQPMRMFEMYDRVESDAEMPLGESKLDSRSSEMQLPRNVEPEKSEAVAMRGGESVQAAADPAPATAPLSTPQTGRSRLAIANRLARLSLAVTLEPQATPGIHFTRRGDSGSELVVHIQDDESARVLQYFVAALAVAIAWLLRKRSIATRATWAVLCLLLPLGLSGLLPLAWTLLLDGIFFGGVGSIALWCAWAAARFLAAILASTPTTRSTVRTASTAILLLLAVGTADANAQNAKRKSPAVPPKIVTNAAAVSAAAAQPATDPAKPRVARPFTLYVPYDPDLGEPRDSRWVYIPYDEFQQLWSLAHPEPVRQRPPGVHALVAEARYDGRGDGDLARFQGRIVIHAFEEEWTRVTLPLGSVALERIEINGQPAAIDEQAASNRAESKEADRSHTVIYLSKPGIHVVDVRFSVPLARLGQTGRFTVPLELAAAGRLRFELPGPELDVQVEGTGGGWRRVRENDREFVDAPIGGTQPISIAWQPRTEAARDNQLVSVDQTLLVDVLDSGVHLHSQFQYSIAQGTVRSLEFQVPRGLAVRAVRGGEVADWSLHDEAAAGAENRPASKLIVSLKSEARSRVDLEIDSYLMGQAPAGSVPVPSPVPLGVTRETGRMAIGCSAQFLVRIADSGGLAQIERDFVIADRPDSPCELLAAYRYTMRPWSITLEITRITPRLKADSHIGVAVAGDRLHVHATIDISISDAPAGSVQVALPQGLRLSRVITPAGSDWFVKTQAGTVYLEVELDQPRVGSIPIEFFASRTRVPGDTSLLVPQLAVRGAEADTGQIAVVLDEDLDAQELDRAAARSIHPSELRGILQTFATSARVFAYDYNVPPTGLRLRLRPARSRLDCIVLSTVSVREGSVAYISELALDVRGASRQSVQFDTPEWLGNDINIQASDIRHIESSPAGGDRRLWTVTFQKPLRGRVQLHLVQMLPIPTSGRIAAALPRPRDAESVRSYVILENRSAAELSEAERHGVSDQPVNELPDSVAPELRRRAISAYKVGGDDAQLVWQRQEREQERALSAIINLADLVTVVSRDGSSRTQAAYIVNNHTQQFLEIGLPERSRLWSVTVAGQPVRPASGVRNGRQVTLVPLEKISVGDFAAQIVVIYSNNIGSELGNWSHFAPAAPEILGNIPVARTLWTVYTPDDYSTRFIERNSNMTKVAAGDHVIARDLAVLEEMNGLLSVAKYSTSPSANRLACDNLKQFRSALDAFQKAPLQRSGATHQFNNLQTWRSPVQRTAAATQLELFCCPSDIGQVRGDQTWAVVQQRASELRTQVEKLVTPPGRADDDGVGDLAVNEYYFKSQAAQVEQAIPETLAQLGKSFGFEQSRTEVDDKEMRRGKLREQNRVNFERVKDEQGQTRAFAEKQVEQQAAAPVTNDRPAAGIEQTESEAILSAARPGIQSIEITVPLVGQPHHFMTLVDQPKLELSARHQDVTQWTAGALWATLCAGIAAAMLGLLTLPAASAHAARHWPWIALATGLAWLYLLPFGIAGAALIIAALGTIAWRTRARRATA